MSDFKPLIAEADHLIDAVDLRRHLVMRPKPCFRHQCNDIIGIIIGEIFRIGEKVLFKGVPDAIVGARLGEVIAATGVIPVLGLDDSREDRGCPVDDRCVPIGAFEHSHAGAGG